MFDTIGKKLALAMGVVLLLMLGLAGYSILGVNSVAGSLTETRENAEEVIYGNELRGNIVQREVDHLNWAAAVNELLTDPHKHNLEVQLDHRQCGFGQWYYGEGRKEAETKVPALAPFLKEIEAPHKDLHDSARKIKNVYRPADEELPAVLSAKISDHLKWAAQVRSAFLEERDDMEVQLDPTKCALGTWLQSDAARAAREELGGTFQREYDAMLTTHTTLHESAAEIREHLAFDRVRAAQAKRAQATAAMDAAAKALFDALEAAMDTVIDPAKDKLDPKTQADALAQWSAIDEKMNENVSQSFLQARILVIKVPAANTPEQQAAAAEAIQTATEGRKAWLRQIASVPALATTRASVESAGSDWSRAATAFLDTCADEREARAVLAEGRRILTATTLPALEQTLAHLETMKQQAESARAGLMQARSIYTGETEPALRKVQGALHKINETAEANIMTDAQMLAAAKEGQAAALSTEIWVGIMSVIAVLVGLSLAIVMGRSIVTQLKRIIEQLNEGAEQTASAAGQISAASQSLAEGATEQAASLEETSSALEEMASMSRQNADNSGQANSEVRDTQEQVQEGAAAVKNMAAAMGEISESSDKINNIIKTIEEIAFQTNLLALNAAVEAARAGEAGKGFAVVADEVRNLAQRAGQAARDTAELIEGTVDRVQNGTTIVGQLEERFGQVETSAGKVAQLIAEISAASSEQAQGVDQVNTAVAQMDKVTQTNAANAEESASASEELSAQAEQLRTVVRDLSALVGGSRSATLPAAAPAQRPAPRAHRPASSTATRQPRVAKPQDVIPLEEDEFKDF